MIKEIRLPTRLGRFATARSVWKRVSEPIRYRNDLREREGRSVRVRGSRSASRPPLGNRPCERPPTRDVHGWSTPSSDQRVRNPPREGLAPSQAPPSLDERGIFSGWRISVGTHRRRKTPFDSARGPNSVARSAAQLVDACTNVGVLCVIALLAQGACERCRPCPACAVGLTGRLVCACSGQVINVSTLTLSDPQ